MDNYPIVREEHTIGRPPNDEVNLKNPASGLPFGGSIEGVATHNARCIGAVDTSSPLPESRKDIGSVVAGADERA